MGRRATLVLWVALRIYLAYQLHYLAALFYSASTLNQRRARLHQRMAIRIRDAAIHLRGIFIKLGQVMSTRIDLLPQEFIEELGMLQDQVPPAPFEAIRHRLIKELGKEIDQVFTYFSPTPIAAASLGQVHEAYLQKDGRKVAVKVQYPDIQQIVAIDLRMSGWLTALLQFWFPHVRFNVLYREFSRIIRDELNYIQEGKNAERFAENFAEDERILVPKVLWDYTTSHILTLEFVEGIKISQVEEMRSKGVDLKFVAGLLAESYMVQILDHRFFHGDPHPGNLFVLPGSDGKARLIFLDFGQMQAITSQMYGGIQSTMRAIILRESPAVVLGLVELGFIDRGQDLRDIEIAVDFFMTRYRDMKPREFKNLTLADIAQDIRQLFKISPLIQIPNHFILFARTSMMLNGLCFNLDPDLNIIELAKPHAQRFILNEESASIFQLLGSWRETGHILLTLPKRLDDFLTTAKTQGVKTQMSSPDMTAIMEKIHRLGHRALLAFTVLGTSLLYIYFMKEAMATEALFAAGGAAFFSLLFLWSMIKPP